jgi:hypothetical protein
MQFLSADTLVAASSETGKQWDPDSRTEKMRPFSLFMQFTVSNEANRIRVKYEIELPTL